MRKDYKIVSGKNTLVVEFDGFEDVIDYLKTAKIQSAFSTKPESRRIGSWSGTNTYAEAMNLFLNGWPDMSAKLAQKLKAESNEIQPTTKAKMVYDVQGFQTSVPRYLQGIPTNMVNKKNFPSKQKVITINKDIYYCAKFSAEEITKQSIKALQIVKKIESQGLRVNLNLLFGSSLVNGGNGQRWLMKIKVKSANERLNISKLAFAMVHPAMSRRICFSVMETIPELNSSSWHYGYGYPLGNEMPGKKEGAELHIGGEYLLPLIINKDLDKVNSVDDLDN